MNLGINNTAFKGHITFVDNKKNYQNIDTKDIQKIYADVDGNLGIDTVSKGHDDSGKSKEINESFTIPSENTQKDYDRFLKVYDIASRNNITINYLNAKSPLDEQLDFLD